MIVLGVIPLLLGYFLSVPGFVVTLGWILIVAALILLVLAAVPGGPVAGGRRHWF